LHWRIRFGSLQTQYLTPELTIGCQGRGGAIGKGAVPGGGFTAARQDHRIDHFPSS
jgi:hypothetical protein